MDAVTARAHDVEETIMTECQKLNSTLTLMQAYTSAIATESPLVIAAMRTPKEMKSKLSKRRRKHLPRIPANIEDIVIPQEYAELVYPNDIPGGPSVRKRFFQEKITIPGVNNRIETSLIFATDKFMRLLFRWRKTYADGTFHIAPDRFKQVLIY